VVGDVEVDPRAFDWSTGLPSPSLLDPPSTPEQEDVDARWREGFDVVIGNPPYVRHERLARGAELMEPTQGIMHPVISEKSFVLAEAGRYTFRVHDRAHTCSSFQRRKRDNAAHARISRRERRNPIHFRQTLFGRAICLHKDDSFYRPAVAARWNVIRQEWSVEPWQIAQPRIM